MNVQRWPNNPIIKPTDVPPSREDLRVIGVFNAGVARFNDEVILLLRVAEAPAQVAEDQCLAPVYNPHSQELEFLAFSRTAGGYDFSDPREIVTPEARFLTSISHLRLARSHDGQNFAIDTAPALAPENAYETFGIEDPRITALDSTFYITYSAISPMGIVTCLAKTADFQSFQRQGIILPPDNKDVVIFPGRISGKYYALHRPSTSRFGQPEIWLAESPDLMCWGNHRRLLALRHDLWDSGRIGASAVPFPVGDNWLEIYHGATLDNKYCLGAALLSGKQPWQVLARSAEPIMEPETTWETEGFFGNVVFSCGALRENGLVKIYYGAADTYVCYAEISLDELLRSLTPQPV